jgi:allantoicase
MERGFNLDPAAFTGFVDLAAEVIGGKTLSASDEFFAGKENLLKPGRGIFLPDEFTDRGKWMDGWETRRKRVPGHDWCIIRLGTQGIIKGVDIDTNHFLGNHPPYASLDALCVDEDQPADDLAKQTWTEILPKVSLKQGSQNVFAVASDKSWTHIRLNIYPDGGVARLKVYGQVDKQWHLHKANQAVDLASILNGGIVVAANDMFFGNKNNMIMPGRAINMGGGWETRRRRDIGHDWAIIELGRAGNLQKIEVDTHHYIGNYPDTCWIEATNAEKYTIDSLNQHQFTWTEIVAREKLSASHNHVFEKEIKAAGPWSHLRLNIAPDGGVSRFHAWGTVNK